MPNAHSSLERKITSLLEQLRSGDNLSTETARHLLWSILKTAPILNTTPDQRDTSNASPIQALPSPHPSKLCFEVVVACPTLEYREKVIEIARSVPLCTAPLCTAPPPQISRRNWTAKDLDLNDDAHIRFAIPAAPDSVVGRLHRSEHGLVFFIQDHYPLEQLIDRLPWPPPNPLLHHWMEDFDHLDAWFRENQMPLAGLGWDALWVTRHGKLTLPTWPLYALQGTRPSTLPNDLHALREEFFFAAGVTKDMTFDCEPRPATELRAERLETGISGEVEQPEITGDVSRRARSPRSRKPRQAIFAAITAFSICAITIVAAVNWGKRQAFPENEKYASHSQSTLTPDTASELPTNAAARLQAEGLARLRAEGLAGLQDDATEGQGPDLLSPGATMLAPETLATALPQIDTDFFQNVVTNDFFPIAMPETLEATASGNTASNDTGGSPQQHTVARPELHDSNETLPTVTSQTNADDRAQIIENANTAQEQMGNKNLIGDGPEQAVPMTVPAIPLRVQIEPQHHQWEFASSHSLAQFRPQHTLKLYETSETVLWEMAKDERAEAHFLSIARPSNASESQHTLYWSWLIPIDDATGRSHRGLIEFALGETALERVRVRLDVQVGKNLELTSASVATWDGGRSWYALSLDKIREMREQLTDRALHIDHALAQAKTTYAFASSTDERALIRTHRKTLEASEQMVETLDSRLGELEKLVALLELHAAFVLVVQTDTLSVANAATPESRRAPQILFQSTLAPTTDAPEVNEN